MIRWRFERDTRFAIPIRVEIHDSEYGGSVIDLEFVGDQPIIEQFGQRNTDPLDVIKGSSAEIRLRGESGDFDDLFSRNNERFLIKLFVDGSLWSEYIPVPDTFSEPVTGGNYEITIKAGNLSLFKQVDVLDILTAGERISKLDGIYQIISHFFSLPIVDGTILYPTGANQSTSALSQIFFNVDRLEDLTAYQALEWLIGKGGQIRIARGKVFVLPVLESQFTGYEYNGTTISGGVLYNQNFSAVKVGGRLSTEKTGQLTYSGVERIYRAGDIENIVPSGDLEGDDYELALGLQGETDNPARIPIGWEYSDPAIPQPPVSVRTDRNEWKIGIIAGDPKTEYSFDANTETSINAGQRLQFKLRGWYDNLRDKDTTFVLRVVVKVGDNYLDSRTSASGSAGGTVGWSSDTGAYLRIPMGEGNTDYQILTTELPTSGDISYRVIINRDFGSAGGNFVYLSEIKSLIANEGGDVITEIDTLAGERGSVYSYTEQFGDGFTSISPGALFFDGSPTETWNILDIGTDVNLSLSDIQTKYLASELLKDRERITGTVDTYDTIALIDSKRVNYTRIDWRYGRSQIELVEIEEHNLAETVEERKTKDPDTGIQIVGDPFFFPEDRMIFSRVESIGFITRDYENETTETLDTELDVPMRSGIEYWVVNESQLDRDDRQAGIYAVVPIFGEGDTRIDYGTGTVDIEEQIIDAPEGSLIFKAPGQAEIDDSFPDFSFVDDTLEVAADTLKASMDLIAQGVNFAKPNTTAVDNITGDVLLSGVTGDLDDIADGSSFKRVASIAVSASGVVLMEQIEGTLDDVTNGASFSKVAGTAVNISGIPLLGQASGDLDDIDNGTNFARVNATSISAGNILMTSVIGDLDDISDGTGFAKVLATSIGAGKILLVEATGDLDDLANGTNFAKVASTQLTAGGIVLLSVVSGDLDDVANGTNFGKVNIINIDAGTGKITLVEAIGDLDDISDGGTYSRILATEVSAGHVKIVGPDGQTVIDQGSIDTNSLVVGETVFIGNNLSGAGGGTNYEVGSDRILIGNAQASTLPYVRAQRDANNYVQMIGLGSASTNAFFDVVSGGNSIFNVKSTGATMNALTVAGTITVGTGGSIVGDNYTIDKTAISFDVSANEDPAKGISWEGSTGTAYITNQGVGSPRIHYRGSGHSFYEIGSDNLHASFSDSTIILDALGYIIRNLQTSAPGGNNGVFTQTANQIAAGGSTKVLCIT